MRKYSLLFSKSTSNKLLNRHLHIEPLKKTQDNHVILHELKNNMQPGEEKSVYSQRSWDEFIKILKPNVFYIYVNKTDWLRSPDKQPQGSRIGHIASFATNDNLIIPESCISLRSEGSLPQKKYKWNFIDHLGKHHSGTLPVATVRFKSIESEFKDHIFKYANPKVLLNEERRRYLVEWSLSHLQQEYRFTIEALLDQVRKVKSKHEGGEWRLFDGMMDDQTVKALNCVKGFYDGIDVCGVTSNPSPQMALWSYLSLVLGDEVRNNLIMDSKLREKDHERVFDDALTRGACL